MASQLKTAISLRLAKKKRPPRITEDHPWSTHPLPNYAHTIQSRPGSGYGDSRPRKRKR